MKRYYRPIFCPLCGLGGRTRGAILSFLTGWYSCTRCKCRFTTTIMKEN